MAYAEKVKSPRGTYWRGKYKDPGGKYVSVRNEHGQVLRFRTKKEAKDRADDREAEIRAGTYLDPKAGGILFKDWVNEWYARQKLSWSTMVNYQRHLMNHLLPFFGEKTLAEISEDLIAEWKLKEEAVRWGTRSGKIRAYKASTIQTWANTLHVVLGDAVPKHIKANPATGKQGRGKRSGAGHKAAAAQRQAPVTGPLGVLLVAERMAILTGRDDEFVMVQDMFWNAHRLGECIGLEKSYVRGSVCKVQWQLFQIHAGGNEELKRAAPGGLLRCPPKDDSYRDAHMAPFMASLLAGQVSRAPAGPCPCHGRDYVFRGWHAARTRRGTVPFAGVAALAGVPVRSVSAVLGNGKQRTDNETRERVLEAARAAGWEPVELSAERAAHWRRTPFEERFTAAVTGRWPDYRGGAQATNGVPLRGEWPGEVVEGRGSQRRAEWGWAPVIPFPADGGEEVVPHPHHTRHWVKTWMEGQLVPEVLSEELLGHELPGVSGKYRHVSAEMRADLAAKQTAAWEAALDARLEMSPRSPAGVLQELLSARLEARKPHLLSRNSPETPSIGARHRQIGSASGL